MSDHIDPLSIPLPPGSSDSISLPSQPPAPDEIPPPPSPPPIDSDNMQISNEPTTATTTTKRKLSNDFQSSSSTHQSDSVNKKTKLDSKRSKKHRNKHNEIVFEGSKEDEAMMKKVMGFSAFDSTKGKMVPGNQVGSVHVVRKRHYRQYMNRKGGFNRPLDKVA